ncbi:MAG: 4-hydroxy-tetrahydrodipicolinate reductase [Oscillospiraceae bacterium]|nr:4-hydroxy-tetrahydrodipicolinate reductase [Oscillospiraceae bacterium]
MKIILSGCNGQMGRAVTRCAAAGDSCEIVAGIDIAAGENAAYPVFTDPDLCDTKADVIIDFSHPSALTPLLKMAVGRGIAAVISTTGFGDGQVMEIKAAAERIPIFSSANMSLGVNLLRELSITAARVLGSGFDIEIVEKHHNQKIDAPSGTALMLADAVSSALPQPPTYIYDRRSRRGKRTKNEIGLHAVRGGTITGEHDVIFAGTDEVITLSHRAYSKEVFAAGSLRAAAFLIGKKPGLYGMADLLDS